MLLSRDERESAVDHAADRLSYLVLSFGVLVVTAYRGLIAHESTFELLALVVAAGLAGLGYRVLHHAASGRWLLVVGVTICVAVAGAAIVVGIAR